MKLRNLFLFAEGNIAAGDNLILPLTNNLGFEFFDFSAEVVDFSDTAAFTAAIEVRTE